MLSWENDVIYYVWRSALNLFCLIYSIADIGKAVAWYVQKIINFGENKSEFELPPWPTMSCIKKWLKIFELVFSFVNGNNNIYI